MWTLIAKAFGIDSEPETPIERVMEVEGQYFVVRSDRSASIGTDKETARATVKALGGDPTIVDRLP